ASTRASSSGLSLRNSKSPPSAPMRLHARPGERSPNGSESSSSFEAVGVTVGIIGGTRLMANDAIPMPPLSSLREDLRNTTEHLARELGSPTARPPEWSEVQWRVAMAVAVMHGISGLLAGRLRWRGPELWTSFLERQRLQGVLRQRHIQQLLA